MRLISRRVLTEFGAHHQSANVPLQAWRKAIESGRFVQQMATLISTELLGKLADHFAAMNTLIPLAPIQTEAEYQKAILCLNQLMGAGAADENDRLANVLHMLGVLIGEYEDRNYSPVAITSVDMLRFLMDQHRLSQSDLPEIGTQGVVSEVLSGKRELDLRQVKALANRFNLPMEAFA